MATATRQKVDPEARARELIREYGEAWKAARPNEEPPGYTYKRGWFVPQQPGPRVRLRAREFAYCIHVLRNRAALQAAQGEMPTP